jgi:hypothetical protein
VLPTELTVTGRQQLVTASAAVKAVEDRMESDLSRSDQAQLGLLLSRCAASLNNGVDQPGVRTEHRG